MIAPYIVRDVSTASREFVEPMGTKKKFWFVDDAGTRWLFKYDHASSLGRELQDGERSARLDGADRRRNVDAYAQRATSAFYSTATDTRPLSPVDAFRQAAGMRPEAGAFWLARLAAVGQNAFEEIVQAVPSMVMSDLSRRFALAVVEWSQGRLLGGAA